MANENLRRAFISYSRVNKDFASKLTRELRGGGYPVWFDLFDIPTGSRWDDEVEKALRDCPIFMIILTPASIASENVKDEIGYAIDHGKRILPVLLEDCDVPLRLRRFQYVDFTTKSFDEGLESAKQLLGNLNEDPTLPKIEFSAPAQSAGKDLAAQKVEKSKPVVVAKKPVDETPQKGTSKGLVIGIVAVVLLIVVGVGVSVLGKSNSPAVVPPTEKPVVVATKVQAPAPTEKPTLKAPAPTEKPTVKAVEPPTSIPTKEPTVAPTTDVNSLIKTARILVYEDTAAEGLWIEPMMKSAGYADNAKFVHDRVGDLKSQLTTSGAKWDLIIIAAESHSGVSGEFWDYVKTNLDAGTAVIIETWTIDFQGNGKIKPILDSCGVKFQADMDLAVPLYWYVSDNEIFNQPNQVSELSKTNRYWSANAGDLMKMGTGNSGATILAGSSSSLADSGAIISCYDGRMILQTFSNHDYPKAQITALWQNYIYNTLKSHFSQ